MHFKEGVALFKMLPIFFSFVLSQYDISSDFIYTRTSFKLFSETYQFMKNRAFFFFNATNLDSIKLNYGADKYNITSPYFIVSDNTVDFSSQKDEKIPFSFWILEKNECRGLNYHINLQYKMDLELENSDKGKEICLFLPFSAVSVKVNDKQAVRTIYKTGTRKIIDTDEINSFSDPYTYPLVIVIPPSNEKIKFEFQAEEPTSDTYCRVTPVDYFNKNDSAMFKYENPFNIRCYSEGEVKFDKIIIGLIGILVSGILLFIMYYYPYCCGIPKKYN